MSCQWWFSNSLYPFDRGAGPFLYLEGFLDKVLNTSADFLFQRFRRAPLHPLVLVSRPFLKPCSQSWHFALYSSFLKSFFSHFRLDFKPVFGCLLSISVLSFQMCDPRWYPHLQVLLEASLAIFLGLAGFPVHRSRTPIPSWRSHPMTSSNTVSPKGPTS